jgi:hypothetical protein
LAIIVSNEIWIIWFCSRDGLFSLGFGDRLHRSLLCLAVVTFITVIKKNGSFLVLVVVLMVEIVVGLVVGG